jgi:ribosomal protein L34
VAWAAAGCVDLAANGGYNGGSSAIPDGTQVMHYPHKLSKLKKLRSVGFRARMKSKKGRLIINRKRRMKRRISPEV